MASETKCYEMEMKQSDGGIVGMGIKYAGEESGSYVNALCCCREYLGLVWPERESRVGDLFGNGKFLDLTEMPFFWEVGSDSTVIKSWRV